MTDNHTPSDGRQALEAVAPRAADALAALQGAAWRAVEGIGRAPLFALAAQVVAAQHELAALTPPLWLAQAGLQVEGSDWRNLPGLDDPARAALSFAEQMSFDVGSIQDAERKALFSGLGADAVPFVQAVYVADFVPRARVALDTLFGETQEWPPAPAAGPDLQPALDVLIRVVPQLQALDPVSTELVRLLGARRHHCRICQSLRSRSALVAGADESLFEAVDHHDAGEGGALSSEHRAALAFADAMIGPPARVSFETAARLRGAYSDAACVELVLDVVRNATNKIAVALAADAPNVESGIEIYDVGPDGELLYGLEAP